MRRLTGLVLDVKLASVACTIKPKVPLVVGMPEIMPLADKDKFGGKLAEPAARDQVYGGSPPVALSCAL